MMEIVMRGINYSNSGISLSATMEIMVSAETEKDARRREEV